MNLSGATVSHVLANSRATLTHTERSVTPILTGCVEVFNINWTQF